MAQEELHVLLITFPTQGHINPFLHLASRLLSLRFSVTLAISDAFSPSELQSRINLLIYPHPPQLNEANMLQFIYSDQSCIHEAVQKKAKELCFGGKEVFSCIICESICAWVPDMAETLKIPFAVFNTVSLATTVLLDNLSRLASDIAPADTTEHKDGIISRIPGLLPLRRFDIPELALSILSAAPTLEKRANSRKKLSKAICRLANSFQELEQDAFQTLADVLPIGPLLPIALLGGDSAADLNFKASNLKEDSSCLEWLQKQAPSSVIYVSFGSVSTMSALQVEELTQGLQASNQPFLWVFRPDFVADDPNFCLNDLKQKIEGQGLVVPWAPQVQVLGHEAVGGFLTHGGWNSMIESISMGVPMLGWPLRAEQHLNCKYVVDGWKIGVRISKNGLILKEEICKLINTLMKHEEGKEMRRRAMELGDIAKRSLMDGGSSFKNLVAFKKALLARRTPSNTHL